MTTPEQHPETAYQTGALPPYTVTHIDPDHLGIPGPERWFVMGTVGGDPRDQQGPVAVCEWEPSAHTIARLLNATAGGRLWINSRLSRERDLEERLGCVLEATWWDRPYDTRLEAIRGMCDLTTDGMTPTDDGDQVRPAPAAGDEPTAGQPPTTDPDRPPPTIDGITLTADELDALTAWSKASSRGGFRVWLEHDTAVEAATRILAVRLDPIAAELSNTQADLDRARERLHRLAGKAGHQPNPADNDASYELSIQLAIEGGQR